MSRFWRRLPIRYKITAALMLIILLVMVTIMPAVVHLLETSLLGQQQRHLANTRQLALKIVHDYQRRVEDYAKLFSDDRELKDSLFYHTELAGEREHPLRAASRLYYSFGLGSVEVGDSQGRVVAAAELPAQFDQDRAADPIIASALQGKGAAGLELTAEHLFIIKASEPIFYHEKQLIGTITAGIRLDQELLGKIKALSDTEIILLDAEGLVIISTLPDLPPGRPGPAAAAAPEGAISLADREYLSGSFPLSDRAGLALGSALILQPNLLPAIILKAHLTLAMLLFAILAVSITLLFLTMRKVTGPLTRLRQGAERIGRGEFNHRIKVDSEDEIGELSREFNEMAENISRLRIVEERLAKAERLAAIGEFASGIAHEVNNPLANVIGIAKLARRNQLAPDTGEDLESIIDNAQRCARIVQDLLSYARQSPPRKEPTAIGPLIEETINLVRIRHQAKAITIAREIPPDLPLVAIDPLQISQVLQNLLINALQAISESGTITITAAGDREMVEIAVADNGYGIAKEDQEHIFHPFFTTKKTGEGTGLGLAICHGIIRNHGGEIRMESRPGVGSTFRLRLPRGESNG